MVMTGTSLNVGLNTLVYLTYNSRFRHIVADSLLCFTTYQKSIDNGSTDSERPVSVEHFSPVNVNYPLFRTTLNKISSNAW